MGCGVGELLTSYLRLPLSASFKSVGVWDGVEKQFHNRLWSGKRQYILKNGKIILI